MSVLAQALLDRGATVSGSDASDSPALAALRARGALVSVGHDAAHPGLAGADRVVISAAVPADNPELAAARAAGAPVVKRAAVLGELMDERVGVAVAGTHGKTTTSAMIAWVLRAAGRDPTFLVGGVIRDLGTGGHWGAGPELVAEADEYDGSFWELRPRVAVITNIEADHLDFYPDLAAIRAAFRRFAANLRAGGSLLLCGADPGARALYAELRAAAPVDRQFLLYGSTADCVWQARDAAVNDRGGTDFRALRAGQEVAQVRLRLPGRHNVLNALGALGAAVALGVAPADAAAALSSFAGTGRRIEVKGTVGGVLVVDDYGHHPTEIAATLAALRDQWPGRRLVVVFQPHTYTRTRSFLAEFAQALAAADAVIVCAIYAARERNTLGISSQDLVNRLDALAPGKAHFAPTLAAAAAQARALLCPGDILLTLGAGDVYRVGDEVLSFEF